MKSTGNSAKQNHGERDHAELSASGSERWLNCPGSIELSKRAPVKEASVYAEEGTEAHECLEFLLRNRTNLKPAIRMAKRKYDIDMVEHCVNAVEYLEERMRELGATTINIETKVSLDFVEKGMFGTLDSSIPGLRRLLIADFKYGAGIAVEPEDNSQLIYYALGEAKRLNFAFEEVELVIIQPRAYHESGETIRSWVTDMGTIQAWEWVFRDGVAEVRKPNAPHNSGPWCRWCPAVTICPKLSDEAFKEAQVVFDDGVVESVPAVKTMAPADITKALRAAEKIEIYIKELRALAAEMLHRGESIDGFKLVKKRAQRQWKDEVQAQVELEEAFGDVVLREPRLLSPHQVEQRVRKLYPKKWAKYMKRHVKKESSGLTMVKNSDRRPAENPLALIFGDVDTSGDDPPKEPPIFKRRRKK